MANNVIKIRRTSVPGRAANTDTLVNPGELALNMADGIMYSTNGSVVFEIGANNTNVNVSGTLTINSISANGTVGASGNVLKSNGTSAYWGTVAGLGGGQVYTSNASAPGSPTEGDEWLDTDTGILYTYVTDGDTSQWVELGPYSTYAPIPQGNLDGGTPTSVYGGISSIDAGGVS